MAEAPDGPGPMAAEPGGRVCAAGWNPAKLRIPDHRRRGAAMAQIEGRCEPRFEAVRGALAQNLDSGEELGASLVVDIDGDNVVDLWGGFCDEARTVPWTERTITNVWSSTKTVTSLAALILAGVRRRWQGRRSGPPRDVALLGGFRAGAPGRRGRSLRLAGGDVPDGGPGAVVGAGHRVGLPRAQLRALGR